MICKGILLVLFLGVLSVFGAEKSHEIKHLPGVHGRLNFKQYGGYIDVKLPTGRNVFYWFVESQNQPSTDPLVLWLQGGPGCAGTYALLDENGPFRVNPDGRTLKRNPDSWNTVANVIYIDSPAGVGFSYFNNPNDSALSDARIANDTYNFLLEFLQLYPQFASNPFWITGESYGGHYIPQLAQRILAGNQQNAQQINLQGFMAGNPLTDYNIDTGNGTVFTLWSHGFISDEVYYGAIANCPDYTQWTTNPACYAYLSQLNAEVGPINPYDLYVDMCLSPQQKRIFERQVATNSPFAPLARRALSSKEPPYQPCSDSYVAEYLNRQNVKNAIHAYPTITWAECSSYTNITYQVSDEYASQLPLYRYLLDNYDLKILIYSGDSDAVVPTTGTRVWLDILNQTILTPWHYWIGSSGQVAGYAIEYQGISFTTIRAAGHMVPLFQPQRALDFFSRFLNGEDL